MAKIEKLVVPCFTDDPKIQDQLRAELNDFIGSLSLSSEVVLNEGKTVKYDVWLPSLNIGVDIHDLSGGRPQIFNRGYLRDRLVQSRKDEVRYLQFFSDEWKNKGVIVKSIIANAVGGSPVKVNGRDCEVEVVTSIQTKPFLSESHIQGATRASDHVVLKHPDHGVIGSVTIRTPIQKKYGHICELARLAFKPGVSVRGGASKLIARAKEISQTKGFEGVLSYAELRFGTGGVYEQCDFKMVGETTTNYWYDSGDTRYDRFKYRAQPGKPEKQVVEEAGVRPVWGAGHRIFLWKP